jgi:hypothetical protein
MSLEREAKRVQRAIRNIPVEAIAPAIAAGEQEGLGVWCLVDRQLLFISPNGGETLVDWDDPVEFAQYVRYLEAHPERVHQTHTSALAFVRSRLGR